MSPGDLEIRINREACRGSGECSVQAPATFALDDDGKALAADPPRDDDEAIARAAGACPRFAIALVRITEAGPQPKATAH